MSQTDTLPCPACGNRLTIPDGVTVGRCRACTTPVRVVTEGASPVLALDPAQAPQLTRVLPAVVRQLRIPVVAFCGAGISMPPPTCAPSWWEFTGELMRVIFEHAPVDLPEMVLTDVNRQPEDVLENVSTILGLDRLERVFTVLQEGEPNANHRALAALTEAGYVRAIFTTNFDTHLEDALTAAGVEHRVLVGVADYRDFLHSGMEDIAVAKLHGTVQDPDSIVSTASQYRAAKGFSPVKGRLFAQYVEESPVLFLGYSGWDFTHPNYQAFWEAIGPRIHRILWNQRSAADHTEGPDLQKVFAKAPGRFVPVVGDLPGSLVDVAMALETPLDSETLSEATAGMPAAVAQAAQRRQDAFREWAATLPQPGLIGVTISDAYSFSKQYQRLTERWKEAGGATAAMPEIDPTQIQELGMKLAAGEITQQEFQLAQLDYMLTAQFAGVYGDIRDELRQAARERAEAAVASFDMQWVQSFYSFAATLGAQTTDIPTILDEAAALADEARDLMASPTPESMRRYQLLFVYAQLRALSEEDMATARGDLEPLAERANRGEITDDEWATAYSDRVAKWYQRAMGIPDGQGLFHSLLTSAATWPELGEAVDGTLVASLNGAAWLTSALARHPAVTELIQEALSPGGKPSREQIGAVADVVADVFAPLRDRVRADGRVDEFQGALDMMALCVWINLVAYQDDEGGAQYQQAWRDGRYPLRHADPAIAESLMQRFGSLAEWTGYAPRFAQLVHAQLAVLGELADNLALVEQVVEQALRDAGGTITVQVRQPIPELLAAMYEERGSLEDALRYYEMALTGMSSVSPRPFIDAIVYRTFTLHRQRGDNGEALRIALTYSPQYADTFTVTPMPCRDALADEVMELVTLEGYSDLEAAKTALGIEE